jgi:hypothetical protein
MVAGSNPARGANPYQRLSGIYTGAPKGAFLSGPRVGSHKASNMTEEELYRRTGRLIETAPRFVGNLPMTADQMTWLGRASALVDASNDAEAMSMFGSANKRMNTQFQRELAFRDILIALYKVLGSAELKSPPGVQGAFIPVGSSFDAYAAVAKVLATAKNDVLIVDPYMDDTVLTDFGGSVAEGLMLRLLTDAATLKPNLSPAAARWTAQYPQRPLQVRSAPPKALHDRAIFIDQSDAWTVTQSLKDLAKRSPAEIVRVDDVASLKIASYESIWAIATVIV